MTFNKNELQKQNNRFQYTSAKNEISLLLFDFFICISQQKIDLASLCQMLRKKTERERANKQMEKNFTFNIMPFLLFYNTLFCHAWLFPTNTLINLSFILFFSLCILAVSVLALKLFVKIRIPLQEAFKKVK